QGTIDGQGAYFNDKDCNAVGITRPMLIRFDTCRDIIISDVTLRNSGVWMQHHFACDNLTIKNVKIYNHCNNCNDGMDINCCRNVTITGVTVDSDDDAICLKSTSLKPCENIKVSNCTISSHCNAMKIGTETLGDFKNISFSNCKVTPCKNKTVVNGRANGISAISIESVDGAAIENVLFTDITVKGTEAPIFVRLGNCGNTFDQKVTRPRRSSIKNITIQNVDVKNAGSTGCSITGIPGQKVENVHLSNITIRQDGGMPKVAAPQDNKESAYPEATMWGTLPATGFFVKNAKNVTFNNVQVFTRSKDDRPSLYKVDVED
ncbi:MAG: glycoside hydrolase, partial [Prevotella sp.]|nr:glycoside hydrolase [Prevotella sp.]